MAWLASLFRLFRRRRPAGRSLLALDSIADVPAKRVEPFVEIDADLVVPPPPTTPQPPPKLEAPQLPPPPPPPASAPMAETAPAPEPEYALEPSKAEPSAVEALSFAPPQAYAPDAPTIELEDDEEVRDFEEEADAQVDPLDDNGRASLDVRLLDALAQTPQRREAARVLALEGVHRIALTDAAGPGSLAEALIALEAEGRVNCTVVDDGGEPCLQYEPTLAPAARAVARSGG